MVSQGHQSGFGDTFGAPHTTFRLRPTINAGTSLQSRLLLLAASTVIAAISGLIVASAMPRGATTAGEALMLMGIGLLTGLLTGFILRSRWAMFFAPIAHVAAFEFGRRGTDGPTVDKIQLDTTYGIVVFVLGRGLYALLALAPMLLGVVYACSLVRRRSSGGPNHRRAGRTGRYIRRGFASISTLLMIGLAVMIAMPASVPPMKGADGKEIAGSVAELRTVELGGHEQWIEIRGASAELPVLLWLDGGPGESGLAVTRVFMSELTQSFVVVDWDQRGAGKSYSALDPTDTWTLDRAVSDTIELTEYLSMRFDEQKIYLAGGSWGSTLGVLAVHRRPDLYHAWIGSGQMVSQLETDRRIYRDLLAYAEANGDTGVVSKLHDYGEPPYADALMNAYVMEQYDKITPEHDALPEVEDRLKDVGPWGILGSEYSFIDKTNVLRGLADMFSVMYPQLQGIDFRTDVPRLEVPVYILLGEYELSARSDLAREWYGRLEAPSKQIFTIAGAGHGAAFEGFRQFDSIMTTIVLPETYPSA